MKLVFLICYHFQHMITYLLKIFSGEREKNQICVRVIPHGLLLDAAKAKAHVRTKQKKKLKRNILLKFYKEKDMPRLS